MKVQKNRDDNVLVSVRSQANKDIGLFLVFTGIVASIPIYYFMRWYNGYATKSARELLPAVYIGLAFVIVGLFLTYFSRKRFLVSREYVKVSEGLFRRPLTYRWDAPPAIRITSLEELRKGQPETAWQIYLASGKYKFLLDQRQDQVEMRGVAEAIAKTLKCTITEKVEDGTDLTLRAEDLDLPYPRRVEKYPHLLPLEVQCPTGCSIERKEESGALSCTWSFCTIRCIIEVAAIGAFFLAISFVPFSPETLSLYEAAVRKNDFFFYKALGLIIFVILFWLIGYRASIRLENGRIAFRESFFGIPFHLQSISSEILEEVRAVWALRGPALQLISDEKILTLRISKYDDAMWLSQEIKKQLLHNAGMQVSYKR